MTESLAQATAATAPSPADERELTLSHLFDAPPALVWKVWTEPEHLARWWGPQGCDSRVERMDLVPGGTFRLVMAFPGGGAVTASGTFREIDPPRRLVYEGMTQADTPCGAGIPPRATVTVSLADEQGKTRLTLHTRFATDSDHEAALAAGYGPSWAATLEAIAVLLAAEAR